MEGRGCGERERERENTDEQTVITTTKALKYTTLQLHVQYKVHVV